MVNQDYILGQHFGQDTTCPKAVNRFEKTVGHEKWPDYWVSVTLTEDGSATLYGIVNFYGYETSAATRPYQYIKEHRFFNGPISKDMFERFLDRKAKWNRTPYFVYKFQYFDEEKNEHAVDIFAPDLDAAIAQFYENYGQPDAISFRRVREATTMETEEVINTGGPHPKRTER